MKGDRNVRMRKRLRKLLERLKIRRELKAALLLLSPSLVVVFGLEIAPLVYSLRYTFYHYNLLRPWMGVYFNGLDNFRNMMFDPVFWGSLKTTFLYVIPAITLQLLLALGIALLLHRKIRGRNLFRSLLILPMVTAPITAAYVWKLMYNPLYGVINYLLSLVGIPPVAWLGSASTALTSIIIIDTWQWTPFMALIILAGLEGLPVEPFEAAKIDGASSWMTFRHLTLPMLKTIILIAVLFRSIGLFQNFDKVLVLTRGAPGTSTNVLGMEVFRNSFKYWDVGYALALGWALFLIVLFIAEVLLHYFGEEFQR